MSSLTEQIEYLKNRCLQNKYDSNNLNDIITLINDMQNETNASDLTKVITSLRKTIIKQIIENDQYNTNTHKRYLYVT